jgi:glyoxylase-like metal-dependent hydrolase (beta-lactamase superfamily II)
VAERLARLVAGVWVGQSPTFATNTGVLLDGSEAVLIDPGLTPQDLSAVKSLLRRLESRARFMVLTHGHWDHLVGAASFPASDVMAQRFYVRVIRRHRQDLMRQVARWRDETSTASGVQFKPPQPTVTFDREMTLRLTDRTFVLIHAPGHAPDQCAVFVPDVGLLWAGDMLSDREPPMAMDGIPRYIETLERLRELPVGTLVPGHGTPTRDAATIRRRFEHDLAYLETLHRCVTRCVGRGASLADTLTACGDVSFVQPDSYPNAHVWNIESAFVASGGIAAEGPNGWEKDWL